MNLIEKFINESIRNHEIAGAAIRVCKADELVFEGYYGMSSIETGKAVNNSTIFRLASMTKPITAIATMILVERGKLNLKDKISEYLPDCKFMKVAETRNADQVFYQADPDNPLTARSFCGGNNNCKLVAVRRIPSVEDILYHMSGIGMGTASEQEIIKIAKQEKCLKKRVDGYISCPLDFQPGEMTGYSAIAAFDILGRIIEIVSKESFQEFLTKALFTPLDIQDIGFDMNFYQQERITELYEHTQEGLKNVTESDLLWSIVNPMKNGYYSGSAGLLGTLEGYDKIVQMLFHYGKYKNEQMLSEEAVRKMERANRECYLQPGVCWGLGMAVFENPKQADREIGEGTFGWSGAYGTHFYIDRLNEITMVLMVNRSNIGGADSFLSRELENIITFLYGRG